MKKHIIYMVAVFILALSACGSAPVDTTELDTKADEATAEIVAEAITVDDDASVKEDNDGNELDTGYENAASIAMQLIIGTIKLEDTAYAVTSDQAPDLLTLWNDLKTLMEESMPERVEAGEQQTPPEEGEAPPQLNESMQALQEEIDTLISGIQSAMTIEQISAIADLQLTQEDVRTFMEENELTIGRNEDGESVGAPGGGGPGGRPGNGEGGRGQPPEGSEGKPPSGNPPQSGEGVAAPEGNPPGGPGMIGDNMIPVKLIDVVIEFLESK